MSGRGNLISIKEGSIDKYEFKNIFISDSKIHFEPCISYNSRLVVYKVIQDTTKRHSILGYRITLTLCDKNGRVIATANGVVNGYKRVALCSMVRTAYVRTKSGKLIPIRPNDALDAPVEHIGKCNLPQQIEWNYQV